MEGEAQTPRNRERASPCRRCEGSGSVDRISPVTGAHVERPCPRCSGTGKEAAVADAPPMTITKEWCERMARLEQEAGDPEIGAGLLARDPDVEVACPCDRFTERECSEAPIRFPGCEVPDER